MSGYKKSQLSPKSNKSTSQINSLIASTTHHSLVTEEDSVSELNSLKKKERKLLVEKKQLLDTLDQLQSKFDNITDKKSQLLAEMEKNLASKQQKSESESSHMLFSVVTWGSSWMDGLVFTVMAENELWAEEVVRQWLNSNGRKHHKIDKVLGIISKDVRAVVNVGAVLLDA